ncbi:MAG: hypothetical protein LUC16_02165 [Coprobacillus sp.]|nr:hypothetical protein [Coprobacillus sp.]
MKFYIVEYKGRQFGETIYPTLERAMDMLETIAKTPHMDVSDFCVQEYEGWATCMRWRYGEKI